MTKVSVSDSRELTRRKTNEAIVKVDLGGTGKKTVAELLASTDPARGEGEIWEAGGFRYQEAASGASDQHVTTAGGVKLYVLPGANGADVKAFGAIGDGVTDDTSAVQAALNGGIEAVYIPDGTFAIKAASTALTLSTSDTTVAGTGYLVPLANASGWAPEQMLLVTGSRNKVQVNLWNSADLGKRTSDGSNEYPMDAIRVTGSENTVEGCCIFNFVVCVVIRGGTGNKVVNNRITVKSVSNLAWPNDGILWFLTDQGLCLGNEVGLAATAAQRTVQMSGVLGASTSALRTGITMDNATSAIVVKANHVGEGFVAGIHSEGGGVRRHTIADNVIYKQRRNAINAAGQRLVIVANRCLGTFNTDTTVNLTGIIGSVDGKAVVVGNTIECDTTSVEGIRILANAEDVLVSDNMFEGTFLHCVNGIANNVQVRGNSLRGVAVRFVSLEKPVAAGADAFVAVEGNFANGITGKFAFLGSGALGVVSHNKILMAEGYTAADGVIEFGGGYGSSVPSAKVHIVGNDCSYVGTTAISGSFAFVLSSASSGTNLRGIIRDNYFDTSIWASIASGAFISGATFAVSGNSTDASTAVGARYGSFTLSAANTSNISNNSVTAASTILLFPLNAVAATLMQGTKSLYISARVAGNRFDVSTADGTAAAGTEQFMYLIEG